VVRFSHAHHARVGGPRRLDGARGSSFGARGGRSRSASHITAGVGRALVWQRRTRWPSATEAFVQPDQEHRAESPRRARPLDRVGVVGVGVVGIGRVYRRPAAHEVREELTATQAERTGSGRASASERPSDVAEAAVSVRRADAGRAFHGHLQVGAVARPRHEHRRSARRHWSRPAPCPPSAAAAGRCEYRPRPDPTG
jgi:hypothetical protein